MATTNGTRALLKAAATGKPVRPVCARNASATLCASLHDGVRVGILCAGLYGRGALDDTACAGLLVELLLREGKAELEDGAHMALAVWRSAKGDLLKLLSRSVHGKKLASLGFEKDIAYAADVDVSGTVVELAKLKGKPALVSKGWKGYSSLF